LWAPASVCDQSAPRTRYVARRLADLSVDLVYAAPDFTCVSRFLKVDCNGLSGSARIPESRA
jgi:hypothetical protein